MATSRFLPLRLCAVAASTLALALAGCGNFFVYPGSTTTTTSTTTGSGSTTTDFAYITNSASAATSLDGFTLSSGTLALATNAPFPLGITPQAAVVTVPNAYLYLASDPTLSTGSIFGFTLGTGGALSILNSGAALVTENSTALEVSPDGKYLFSLNSDGLTIEQYSINTSTGALSFVGNYSISSATTGGAVVPTALKFAPSGDFLVALLGTGGAETFAYTTSTGALAASSVISPANSGIGIYGADIDSNGYLYLAGTAGLQVFSTTTAGVATFLNTYTTGNGAHGVALNSTYTFVYVANFSDGTISGFSVGTGGALTALTGSPFTAPADVIALARDNSGQYLIAAGYSATSGIQIDTIASSGALTTSASAASGTSTLIPTSLALTH